MNDNNNIFNNSNDVNVDSTNVNNTIDTSTNNKISEPVQNNNVQPPVTEYQPVNDFNNQPNLNPIPDNNIQPSTNITTEPIINSGSNNNKSKKGFKIILIILVIGLLVGAGILFVPKLFNKNSSGSGDKVKITGSVELIKEFKKDGNDIRLARGFENGPYFKYVNEKEDKESILDMNGNTLFDVPSSSYTTNVYYINDGYFAYTSYGSDKFNIYNIDGTKKEFNRMPDCDVYYKDGKIYYTYDDKGANVVDGDVIVYDLKNNKELWKNHTGATAYAIDNDILIIKKSYNKQDVMLEKASTGEEIKTPECEHLLASFSAYYAVYSDKVEVYDYNNKLLSTYNLESNENYYTELVTVLNTGGYVIGRYNKQKYEYDLYTIYNKNGKEVAHYDAEYDSTAISDGLYSTGFSGVIIDDYSSPKYAFLQVDDSSYRPKSYIIFDDDTYYELYDVQVKGKYAIGYIEEKVDKVKVINLETKEATDLDEQLRTEFKLPDGDTNYLIIPTSYDNKDYAYVVYDKNFKEILKIDNNIDVNPVNEDYFLKAVPGDNAKISLINANTKKESVLDTKGRYNFNTENNLVTYEYNGNKQWLYKFK